MAKKKKNDKHLYNLDIYLAKVIAKELKAYEEAAVGVPSCFCYDKDFNEIPIEKAEKRWHKVLKKMIWSFDEIAKDHPNSFCTKFNEYKKPEDFKKAADRYDERIDEGLKLFAEYFQSLWI